MNNSALDRSTFEAIEAYVLDRLGAEERAAFEQRMAGDAALRGEVELERENIRAVELGGVTRVLNQVIAEERAQESTAGWSRYLKYAAVIAVLVSGGIWWATRATPGEQLFAEHFVADPGLPVTMSATNDPAFSDAMVSYKEGNYSVARAKWSPLLQQEPMNDTLRYYIASASLAMDDEAAATPLLEGLANDTASAFRAKSQWYLFLAYIKQGQVENARALSLDKDPTYGERVRAIKAELK